MNKPKIILIPSVDSVVNTYAKFTKGKRYTATAFTKCSESFMREPFSRIAELEKQVAFLTGELQAAIATIEKIREIMRTEPGYDVEDHARVLRMMADAFAKLQQ